jgi:Outer membrane protein beta-barrel domain
MSDHEFEKRVRQELNDLKLKPSGDTWVKIEEALKKKRRRTPILWLPLLLLGLAAGGYIYFNQSAGKPTSAALAGTKPTVSKELSSLHSAHPETKTASATISPEVNKKQGNASAIAQSSDNDLTSDRKPSAGDTKNQLTGKTPSASGIPNKSRPELVVKKAFVRKADDDLMDIVVNDMITKENDQNKRRSSEFSPAPDGTETAGDKTLSKQFTVTSQKGYLVPDIYADHKTADKSGTPIRFLPQLAKAAPVIVNKRSRWSYAVTASVGSTMIGEGKLGVKKSLIEDVSLRSAGVSALNGNQSFSPTIPAPGPYRPSSINPGLGYTFGGIVKHELSKRFSISAGLNYARLTTYSIVGQQINQTRQLNNGPYGSLTVTSYFLFQEDQTNKSYKNRYHFIELPVTLHTTLINSKTLPLYWNAGISLSRLMTSNSLFFDGTSGVYYRDKKLINQTQTALLTGFSVALMNRSHHPLWIGPELRYNLSEILKKDLNGNKHLMYLGAGVKWFLRK